jgi:hypothetical protein
MSRTTNILTAVAGADSVQLYDAALDSTDSVTVALVDLIQDAVDEVYRRQSTAQRHITENHRVMQDAMAWLASPTTKRLPAGRTYDLEADAGAVYTAMTALIAQVRVLGLHVMANQES